MAGHQALWIVKTELVAPLFVRCRGRQRETLPNDLALSMRPHLERALASVQLAQEAAVGFVRVQSEAAKRATGLAVIDDASDELLPQTCAAATRARGDGWSREVPLPAEPKHPRRPLGHRGQRQPEPVKLSSCKRLCRLWHQYPYLRLPKESWRIPVAARSYHQWRLRGRQSQRNPQ